VFGTPGNDKSSMMHTEKSGELNLTTLEQIEDLLSKKAGAKFERHNKNKFTLNGYAVCTEVDMSRFAPDVFEESFYEIANPANVYKLRLIKNPDGSRELAILIQGDEGLMNYHAVFDCSGIMFDEDPWGSNQGYTIEIFDVYKKYQQIFAKRVDGIEL